MHMGEVGPPPRCLWGVTVTKQSPLSLRLMSFWVPIPLHGPGVWFMWVSLNFRMIHGSCLEASMHWNKWCGVYSVRIVWCVCVCVCVYVCVCVCVVVCVCVCMCVCVCVCVCVCHAQVKMLLHTNSSEVTQTSETPYTLSFLWFDFLSFPFLTFLFMVVFVSPSLHSWEQLWGVISQPRKLL